MNEKKSRLDRDNYRRNAYEEFKSNFKKLIADHEDELIELIRTVSETYNDVERELNALRQEATYHGDKILLEIINRVEMRFTLEKGSLPLK
ncbi:hypothetical protein [Bacillus altitudinis]|uniref:hypothetical protein n=1 Tax=Bacillus altitudinis TaxID=293387 RepID=UPI00064C6890|nr:hypothetical protein [Bacillus altitudinis]KLV14052.1 hypothetical protein ABW03_20410 [Bacillus altitudinis]